MSHNMICKISCPCFFYLLLLFFVMQLSHAFVSVYMPTKWNYVRRGRAHKFAIIPRSPFHYLCYEVIPLE